MLALGFLPISRLIRVSESFTTKYWEVINNQGTLDIPFVLLNFDLSSTSKILDFGCGGSVIPLYLATFGYKVTGIDFRYGGGYSHKNFTFLKKNFFDVNLEKGSFDCVIATSTLEHVGMGHYGESPLENGDMKAMEKIRHILKPGGVLFLTVPGGRGKIYEKKGIKYVRIYEPSEIEQLCKGFKIEKELFFKKEDQEWIPAKREEMTKIEFMYEDNGVILIKARLGD